MQPLITLLRAKQYRNRSERWWPLRTAQTRDQRMHQAAACLAGCRGVSRLLHRHLFGPEPLAVVSAGVMPCREYTTHEYQVLQNALLDSEQHSMHTIFVQSMLEFMHFEQENGAAACSISFKCQQRQRIQLAAKLAA